MFKYVFGFTLSANETADVLCLEMEKSFFCWTSNYGIAHMYSVIALLNICLSHLNCDQPLVFMTLRINAVTITQSAPKSLIDSGSSIITAEF